MNNKKWKCALFVVFVYEVKSSTQTATPLYVYSRHSWEHIVGSLLHTSDLLGDFHPGEVLLLAELNS